MKDVVDRLSQENRELKEKVRSIKDQIDINKWEVFLMFSINIPLYLVLIAFIDKWNKRPPSVQDRREQ